MIFGAQRLRFEPVTALIERRPALMTALLCALWMISGLVGHDPWKPQEAAIFGVVFQLMQGGDWVVPMLAGEPFLRHPPLYYLFAAGFGHVLSPPLAPHDAARLVNVVFGGLTFWLIAGTATRSRPSPATPDTGWIAPLLLLGCVGLLLPAHQLIPDNGLITAFALGAWALTISTSRPFFGGAALGAAIGLAFLTRGVGGALMLAVAGVALPALSAGHRHRRHLSTLIAALFVAAPLVAIWPLALHARDPALFAEWLYNNELGRLLGLGRLASERDSPFYYLGVLPWFAFPALPFAAWSLYAGRRALTSVAYAVPLVLFATALIVSSVAHDARELYALPMLVPLALLAVPGVASLRRSPAYLFFWFSITFFVFFLAVVWFYWLAVDFGIPARVSRHMADMEPGYTPVRSVLLTLIAIGFTAAWVLLMFNVRRSPQRPFVAWASGTTAFVGVLMTLMVAWVDNAKSYRGMIDSFAAALPVDRGCIASISLGESQRALLHYFAGITTLRYETAGAAERCDLVLTQGNKDGSGTMTSPWQLLWEGQRPGDHRERYRLYRRKPEA